MEGVASGKCKSQGYRDVSPTQMKVLKSDCSYRILSNHQLFMPYNFLPDENERSGC